MAVMTGKYADTSGASSCDSCSAGQFAASMSQSLCFICPPGHYSAAGQIKCEECETGESSHIIIQIMKIKKRIYLSSETYPWL